MQLLFLLSFFLVAFSFSKENLCPEWLNKENLPKCPESPDSRYGKLDDSFPALMHVISEGRWNRYDKEDLVNADYEPFQVILNLLKGNPKRPPLFLLLMDVEKIDAMKSLLLKYLDSEEGREYSQYKDNWLQLLRAPNHMDSNKELLKETWLQDALEQSVVFNQAKINLQFTPDFQDSEYNEALLKNIQEIALSCGFSVEEKKTKSKQIESLEDNNTSETGLSSLAFSGGNIEALPGGWCMTSTEVRIDDYFGSICPPNRYIQIEGAEYFPSGHVDEVIKMIPYKTKEKGVCPFQLVYADFDLGLKLLEQGADITLGLNTNSENDHFNTAQNVFAYDYIWQREQLEKFLEEKNTENDFQYNPHNSFLSTSESNRLFEKVYDTKEPVSNRTFRSKIDWRSVSNGEILRLVKSREGLLFLARDLLSKQRRNIERIQEKYSCKLRSVALPILLHRINLVGGYIRDEKTKEIKETTPYFDPSLIFPNPINGIVEGAHFVTNKTFNPTFDEYIRKNLGSSLNLVDTLAIHRGSGGLHCATLAIRGCNGSQ